MFLTAQLPGGGLSSIQINNVDLLLWGNIEPGREFELNVTEPFCPQSLKFSRLRIPAAHLAATISYRWKNFYGMLFTNSKIFEGINASIPVPLMVWKFLEFRMLQKFLRDRVRFPPR